MRFGDQVEYSVEVEREMDKSFIPFNTLQPLVENCFKHGFKDRTNALKIKIEIRRDGSDLMIKVIDDGCGIRGRFNQDTLLNSTLKACRGTMDCL